MASHRPRKTFWGRGGGVKSLIRPPSGWRDDHSFLKGIDTLESDASDKGVEESEGEILIEDENDEVFELVILLA